MILGERRIQKVGLYDCGGRTIRVLLTGHEGKDGLGIVVCLLLTRSTRILSVIGQLVDATQITDCVTMSEEKYNTVC